MSLIKWEPFDDFDRLFRELTVPSSRMNNMSFDLAADLYEDGDDLVAEMNLPGLKGDDIDIEVEDNQLRVSGRREEVQEKKEKSHYSKEIRRGTFHRVISLPDRVEEDKVEAEYHDGVLTVIMPKRHETNDKRVKVKVK